MELNAFILAFFSLVCWLYLWQQFQRKKKGSLPGPKGIPLLGNVLQIGFEPHLKFTEWSKKYGPIFGIKMGMQDAFVVSDIKLLKELLKDQVSAGRMVENPVFNEFTKGPNNAIANTEGAKWEQHRAFTVKTLKNLGFNKSSMESLIMDEVQSLLQYFRNSNEQPISGNGLFNAPVINSLWRLVSSERCEWEKGCPKIQKVIDEFFSMFLKLTTNGLFFAPFLRFIAPEFLGWNNYKQTVKNVLDIFEESIQQHQKTFKEDNLRDFIDHFLYEIKKTTNRDSSFHKSRAYDHLMAHMMELFIAGSETTSTTLEWTMHYLSQYPKMQERIQNEIDNVLGSSLPTLQDKFKLPYTEAVISEILRISPILPLGVPHRMLDDKILDGYFLKKGTQFFCNLYAIHHDEYIWGDPYEFRPERFLNEDGTKYLKNPALISFGEGKRRCIGEQLAKDTMFLFLACILQEFNILSENPANLSTLESDFGLVPSPKPFKVIVLKRSQNDIAKG